MVIYNCQKNSLNKPLHWFAQLYSPEHSSHYGLHGSSRSMPITGAEGWEIYGLDCGLGILLQKHGVDTPMQAKHRDGLGSKVIRMTVTVQFWALKKMVIIKFTVPTYYPR